MGVIDDDATASSPTISVTASPTSAEVGIEEEQQPSNQLGINLMQEELLIVGIIGIGAFILALCLCIGVGIYCCMQKKKYQSSTSYVEEVQNEDAGWWGDETM